MADPKRKQDLQARFPSLKTLSTPAGQTSQQAWVAVFKARPDVMHQLLADFIKHAYAKQGRVGQRPMPKEEEVDFQALIYGEDNDRPLPEVLPLLIGETSIRQFARDTHMSNAQVHRMLRGQYQPDVAEMRLIANAVGKSPMFFVEYRKAMVLAAMSNLLDKQPGFTTTLYRRYLEIKMEGK